MFPSTFVSATCPPVTIVGGGSRCVPSVIVYRARTVVRISPGQGCSSLCIHDATELESSIILSLVFTEFHGSVLKKEGTTTDVRCLRLVTLSTNETCSNDKTRTKEHSQGHDLASFIIWTQTLGVGLERLIRRPFNAFHPLR